MANYAGQQVVVVGAGRSGSALARYFLRRGARVLLSDRRRREELSEVAALEREGVILELGGHTVAAFTSADLVVLSPGVPGEIPPVRAARAAGVPVRGEIEIAAAELSAPLIGITGTNGKSTTTTLMGEAFAACGRKVFVGGNLGTPLIEAVGGAWDLLVVELSSFQLEEIERFRPRVGVLLNITEDHLDRYPDMESYVAAKARLFENQLSDDVAVLNADDPRVLEAALAGAARQILFSSTQDLAEGMFLAGEELVWRHAGEEQRFALAGLRLRGRHNLENAMAALIPPLLLGCAGAPAWSAMCAFRGLPHRMEVVTEFEGVTWYNDSKGTNVGSVVKSLAGLEAPVTLIAGGKDKGGDYAPLLGPVRDKVAHLILIGEAAVRIEAALGQATLVHHATTMEEAVRQARTLTPAGGSVLLSPGCSSFDMFRNYEERGEIFARAVRALAYGSGEASR